MHVFVTGATGWIGMIVVKELIDAGHRVSGLVRSEDKIAALASSGASIVRGTLDELDVLRDAAARTDAVIHLGFNHDFSKFAENSAQDKRAIETMGAALEGSHRPLIVTSGVALVARPGHVATEADSPPAQSLHPRKSEDTARALATRGVHASTIRLPPSVHGVGETHGFIPTLIRIAREKGVSAYIGDGSNRWPAVHRRDAGRLYRLALESGVTQPTYHAIAEEGIPFKAIAEVIGRRLGLPVESRDREHFGWFASFAGADMAASSQRTREVLGWTPTEIGLLDDVDQAGYFEGCA